MWTASTENLGREERLAMALVSAGGMDPDRKDDLKATGFQEEGTCRRIAVVDDELPVLKSIERIFMDDCFELDLFDRPEAALESMEHQEYAVVLSDQRMPGLTGIELLSRVREAHPDTVCIMLTSYTDVVTMLDAINRLQVYQFLAKPWNEGELRLAIINALERYRLKMENRRLLALTLQQVVQLKDMNAHLESLVEIRTAEISHLLETAKRGLAKTVCTLSELMEFYDPVLVGHMKRVAEWVGRLAPLLISDKEIIEQAGVAALLHDIGLVGIPRTLLKHAEESLNKSEAILMRQHPEQGFLILNHIEALQQVASFVRSHHENYDGNGYPDSIKGKKIPLVSRMIHVASDYDHMISRRGMDSEKALEVLVQCSGRIYDPEVVTRFQDVLSETGNMEYEDAIHICDLEAGMVLARNVLSTGGRLLLVKDCILKETHVRTLERLNSCSHVMEPLYVFRKTGYGYPDA